MSIQSVKRFNMLVWLISTVMLAIAAMALLLAYYSGQEMDRQARQSQLALVDNALTSRINRGLGELRSVAWWDDAVRYSSANEFDREWLDQEIGSYMVESYKHDRVMILDENNQAIYVHGEGTGLGTQQLLVDLKAASKIIAQARGGRDVSPRVMTNAPNRDLYEQAENSGRRFARGFGGIVAVDGKMSLALATLITPSYDVSGTPPKRRIVLTLTDVTTSMLREIGGEVLMPDLSFGQANAKGVAKLSIRSDIDQKPLTQLQWAPKRPGTEMLRNVLPIIMAALLIAGLFLAVLVRQLRSVNKIVALREVEAQHLANHDALTGLPNRRQLETRLFKLANKVDRSSIRLACAIVDLDRFKDINDTLGHQAGDALIQAVASRLREKLPQSDFLARLGGDEFAVLRECRDLDGANDLSAMLATAFGEAFPVLGHQIDTSASIGLSVSSLDRALEDLMREADIALYEAKAKHKGGIIHFAPAMAAQIATRHMLEVDLKQAIAKCQLTMNYQPIVEASTGAISSVEALVRWHSPKHGQVPPDVFVAIAEETGMMADLGRIVIDQAIADAGRWPQISTAINLSPAQVRSATIIDDLTKALRRHGVSAKTITLEITESVLLANDHRTRRTLNILKEMGFGLSLDDFGTGYSSLAYVRDFPFDRLKIDRSFVQGQSEKGRSLEIIKAVVNFGLILGREVVAEGIETETEMQAMQSAGATHLQGYLFSKPVPAPHIEALIAASGRLTAARTTPLEAEEAPKVDRSLATKLRRVS